MKYLDVVIFTKGGHAGGRSNSGVSRGVFWLPGTPPPPAMIFINQGGDTVSGTDLHLPLHIRVLETPLETNSGYATEQGKMKCLDVVKGDIQPELGAIEDKMFDRSVWNPLWRPMMGKPKEENIRFRLSA